MIVRILFNEASILGVLSTGGFVAPTLQNSFLLMGMRMAVVVPLLAMILAPLHAQSWGDIRKLSMHGQRHQLIRAVGGGGLMFTYLALLYVSIGMIPTGIALTLFFTYPVFTALFSWRFFGSCPTLFRWGIMALVLLGSVLTLPSGDTSLTGEWGGVGCGIASGIAYALYTVNAQKSFETMHPVPFTWISFATTLVLCGGGLVIGYRPDTPLAWTPLWIGGVLSAIATATGHLLNNIGIRRVGATSAAMIGASNPALTVVLAWFAIDETLSALQVVGIVIVTLSVVSLIRERQWATKIRRSAPPIAEGLGGGEAAHDRRE